MEDNKTKNSKPVDLTNAKPPTMFEMLRNFSSELSTYIKNGSPNVSEENYTNRLKACQSCEHLNKKLMRCKLCGCLIQHKAKWKTTTCPDKPQRWVKENIEIKK
jgi:hypothetical protein